MPIGSFPFLWLHLESITFAISLYYFSRLCLGTSLLTPAPTTMKSNKQLVPCPEEAFYRLAKTK